MLLVHCDPDAVMQGILTSKGEGNSWQLVVHDVLTLTTVVTGMSHPPDDKQE